MEERLSFHYDPEGDILDVSVGVPRKALSLEVGDDILERVDPETKGVVGFTILNFKKHFQKMDKNEFKIPIKAKFVSA